METLCSWWHQEEEDEGLEIDGWILRWSCVSKGRRDDPPDKTSSKYPSAQKDELLPLGTWRRTGFCCRTYQIRVSWLCFPQTINAHLSHELLPYFLLLWNKRSVQGMPKYNWIKMQKSHSFFPLLLLGCLKGYAQHAKKTCWLHTLLEKAIWNQQK